MISEEPDEIKDEESDPASAAAPEGIENLEEALEAEKKKAEEYLAHWQRVQADFINYKRRTEAARQEFNSFANSNIVLAILPVLDDLERAINAIEGVSLFELKFNTVLEGQGVKPILSLGMAFDPNYHEAMRQDKGKEGVIIEELQKGYTLNDKLLRPAKVVVGRGHKKDLKKEEDTKEEEENG
jgi:molecular chaperone GrpE